MATAIRLAVLALLLCGSTAWAGATLGLGFGSHAVARWIDIVQSLSWSGSGAGWSTNAYEFGTHDAGTTANATFTITNSGNDTAEDVATSVTGAGFRLYSTTTFGNISAGRTRVAKVAFTPTGAGAFGGFANYSAPNIGRTGVALSGTGAGVVEPPATGLLTDTFEGTSGATLASYGWSGTSQASLSLSNTVAQQGSTAAKIAYNSTTNTTNYKTFTQQTSGTFTVQFYYYYAGTPSGNLEILTLDQGAYTWSSSFMGFWALTTGGALEYRNSAAGYTVTGTTLTADTWHLIKIQATVGTPGTWSMWADGVAVATNIAAANSGKQPDRITLSSNGLTGFVAYIDNLTIQTGAQ